PRQPRAASNVLVPLRGPTRIPADVIRRHARHPRHHECALDSWCNDRWAGNCDLPFGSADRGIAVNKTVTGRVVAPDPVRGNVLRSRIQELTDLNVAVGGKLRTNERCNS